MDSFDYDDLIENKWGGQFKFEAYDPRHFYPPAKAQLVNAKEVYRNRDSLILGEPKIGLTSCSRWLKKEMEGLRLAVLNCRNWTERGVFISPSASIDDDRKQAARDLFVNLGEVSNAGECLRILEKWTSELEKNCYLIFFKPPSEKSRVIAEALRSFRESGAGNQLNIIIFSNTEDTFLEQSLQSGYLDYCHVFRPASLDREDIGFYLANHFKSDEELVDEDLLDSVFRFTGGHPMLIKEFSEMVTQYGPVFLEEGESDILEIVFDDMKNSKPGFAQKWVEDLKGSIEKNPECAKVLKNYLSTSVHCNAIQHQIERPLYVSGWLCCNDSDRWGLASRFHKSLVRSVLVEK